MAEQHRRNMMAPALVTGLAVAVTVPLAVLTSPAQATTLVGLAASVVMLADHLVTLDDDQHHPGGGRHFR
jgi:hypothetical protein